MFPKTYRNCTDSQSLLMAPLELVHSPPPLASPMPLISFFASVPSLHLEPHDDSSHWLHRLKLKLDVHNVQNESSWVAPSVIVCPQSLYVQRQSSVSVSRIDESDNGESVNDDIPSTFETTRSSDELSKMSEFRWFEMLGKWFSLSENRLYDLPSGDGDRDCFVPLLSIHSYNGCWCFCLADLALFAALGLKLPVGHRENRIVLHRLVIDIFSLK